MGPLSKVLQSMLLTLLELELDVELLLLPPEHADSVSVSKTIRL